jgi:hypothetical protein
MLEYGEGAVPGAAGGGLLEYGEGAVPGAAGGGMLEYGEGAVPGAVTAEGVGVRMLEGGGVASTAARGGAGA